VYAGGASCICGVEEQENRSNEFTHILAHPGLACKPLIGPGMGGDPELIMAVRPEVIFMSCTTAGDADELQRRTGIPVFTIEYGDLGRNRPVFYRSLRQIGEVLRTGDRVDTLIAFIDAQIADLRKRTAEVDRNRRVYVGGISYRGQKGIVSTDPYYAAFGFLGVDNVASTLDSAFVSPVTGTYIDWEQLINWDPDVIFVDAGGWPLVREEFGRNPGLNRLLKACRSGQLYALWPYNNHHSNFEVMLTNAWYAGKVLYPERFSDITIEDKINEVMTRFVGAPIAPDLAGCWGRYRNLAVGP
ncbi:MAG: ABC transporter substrate-binding protein, partial [Odoribacter sp.]|nr:ABC transporter substrate-binding protein [Odoribacter sp.]